MFISPTSTSFARRCNASCTETEPCTIDETIGFDDLSVECEIVFMGGDYGASIGGLPQARIQSTVATVPPASRGT